MKTRHSNRRAFNWLIYRKIDSLLLEFSTSFSGTLYDFGCGDKPYEAFFNEYTDKYVGLDWGNSLYDSKANVIADLNKELPIEDEVADCIVSISVLEHLSEPKMMVNEAYRGLKKGGSIILQVPFQWKEHEAPYDFQRFTKYGLEKLLSEAGFICINIRPIGGLFTSLALKLNYFLLRLEKGPSFFRMLIRVILTPIWYINQVLALFLDKLDNHPSLETVGYWVSAKKGND